MAYSNWQHYLNHYVLNCTEQVNFSDNSRASVEYYSKCANFPAIPPASPANWLQCGSLAESFICVTGSPTCLAGESRMCTDPNNINFGSESFLSEGANATNRFGINATCDTVVDVNFFQTFLDVPAGLLVDAAHPFLMNVSGDDGGRITIFNSANPTGCVVSWTSWAQRGSFFAFDNVPTQDLSSCIKTGETNRLVITQIDTCETGNSISAAYPSYNGALLTTAAFQPIDCAYTGPSLGPCNATCGANGTQSVTYIITTPANSLGVQCPQNSTQSCAGPACTGILSLVKDDCVSAVIPGSSYTYTLTVANTGGATATGVNVTDMFPFDSLEVTSLPGACSISGNLIACTLGSIAAGSNATLNIGYRVLNNASIGNLVSNCASVSADAPAILASSTDCDLDTITVAFPVVNVTCSATACPGKVVFYVVEFVRPVDVIVSALLLANVTGGTIVARNDADPCASGLFYPPSSAMNATAVPGVDFGYEWDGGTPPVRLDSGTIARIVVSALPSTTVSVLANVSLAESSGIILHFDSVAASCISAAPTTTTVPPTTTTAAATTTPTATSTATSTLTSTATSTGTSTGTSTATSTPATTTDTNVILRTTTSTTAPTSTSATSTSTAAPTSTSATSTSTAAPTSTSATSTSTAAPTSTSATSTSTAAPTSTSATSTSTAAPTSTSATSTSTAAPTSTSATSTSTAAPTSTSATDTSSTVPITTQTSTSTAAPTSTSATSTSTAVPTSTSATDTTSTVPITTQTSTAAPTSTTTAPTTTVVTSTSDTNVILRTTTGATTTQSPTTTLPSTTVPTTTTQTSTQTTTASSTTSEAQTTTFVPTTTTVGTTTTTTAAPETTTLTTVVTSTTTVAPNTTTEAPTTTTQPPTSSTVQTTTVLTTVPATTSTTVMPTTTPCVPQLKVLSSCLANATRIDTNGYWCVQVAPNSFFLKFVCAGGAFTTFVCPHDCTGSCLPDPVTTTVLGLGQFNLAGSGTCLPAATLPNLGFNSTVACTC